MVQPIQHGLTHARTRVERSHGDLFGVLGGGGGAALFAGGILQGAGILTNATVLGVP